MKKWLILIILGFILASIFTINYTNQVINTFTGFDEDEDGEEGEDSGITAKAFEIDSLDITSQQSELSMIWSKMYLGDYVDVAQSIINSRFGDCIQKYT